MSTAPHIGKIAFIHTLWSTVNEAMPPPNPPQPTQLPPKTIIVTFSHCQPGDPIPRPGGGSHRNFGETTHTDKYAINIAPTTTFVQIQGQLVDMVEKKWRMRMSPSRWCIRILVDMKGTQVNAEDEATLRGCRDAILRGKTEAMEFKFFERSIGELGAGGGGCCVIL
jgi:hypothetical protein